MTVYKLTNTIQNYPWGSRTSLSSLLGMVNPGHEPQAELWMGAHPKAPSKADGTPLGDLIAADPGRILGAGAAAVFAGKLPFLFKVLAAGSPLSIQAHPSLDEAKARFAGEEAAGVPFDAFHRNYKDPNHKPEILCALTPFSALWGFRPLPEIAAVFRRLGPSGETLAASPDLKSFFRTLMEGDEAATASLLAKALEPGVLPGTHSGASWVSRLAELYPGDVGALAPLYLNVVALEPGEAIYIPAGELHAYLDGTGMELMANSDNVLRGGLTPKHVDIPELLSVLNFRDRAPAKVSPRMKGGVTTYPTPAKEFLLSRIELAGTGAGNGKMVRNPESCEILLALSGSVTLTWAGGRETLTRGESCFVGADTGTYGLEGQGVVFAASVPGASAAGEEEV